MAKNKIPAVGFCRAAHGGPHLLSLCLSIAVWGLLVATVLCASSVMPVIGSDGSCEVGPPATLLVLMVLAYSLEVALSSTRQYLSSINESEDIISFVKRMKLTPPVVGFGIVCSHLEERLETATGDTWRSSTVEGTSTDDTWRNLFELGSSYDAWRRWCSKERGRDPVVEEVATWRVTEDFEYDYWKDRTGNSDWLRNQRYTVIKLHVTKAECPMFMDAQTEAAYGLQKRDFLNAHRKLDQRFGLYDYVEVAGYQPIVLGLRSDDCRPWWLSVKAFYLVSLLGLTWPYRLYLGFRSLEASICIRKAIHCEEI